MLTNKSMPDCTDPWLDTSFNCWPLHESTIMPKYYRRPSSVERPTYTEPPFCCPPGKPGPLPELP